MEQNAALNARNLLNSLFQGPVYGQQEGVLRPEFDINSNGVFDSDDAQTLAILDGDETSLSSNDLNIASTNWVMNKRN